MRTEREQIQALVEQGRMGDPQAQEALVHLAQNRVYYHCKKMLKNEEDARDATQDVLLVMLTSLDKLKEPAAFWGWVNGITANRCRHLLSTPHKEWQIPEDDEGNSMLENLENLDETLVPEKALDNEETRRMILGLVDDLPPEQRMCVLFYYYDEMSVKDIAQAMGTSEGTVKSRLNYARKAIKYGVEDYERKGVKLYSASPILLLLCFLRREAEATALDGTAAAAMASQVLSQAGGAATAATAAAETATAGGAATGASTGAGVAAGTAAGTGAAAGAASGISIKVVAAILAGVIAIGGIAAGVISSRNTDSRTETPDQSQSDTVLDGGDSEDDSATMPETFAEYARVDVSVNRVTLVDTAGNLYLWGMWDKSQNTLRESGAEPQKVMEDIRMVRSNRGYIAAIRTDGTLYFQEWDTLQPDADPEGAFNLKNLVDLDVGSQNNSVLYAAVQSDGSLWMWGGNRSGEICGVSDEFLTEPVKVMEDVAQVRCGAQHVMVLKTDGTLWAWGWNALGQLGTGNTEDAVEPVMVMEDVAYIDCTSEYSAAVKTDGTLWMWGRNRAWTYDEYEGNDSYTGVDTTPTPELIAEDVAKVSCGESDASILKTDGTLWMWVGRGYNVSAMDGRTGLVQVMDNVVDAATDGYTVALRADGTVWMWGGISGPTIDPGVPPLELTLTPTQLEFTVPVENLGSVSWLDPEDMGEQEPEPVDLAGAYAAYRSVLQSHGAQISEYASWYEAFGELKPVNFVDIYGDAVPEMIFVEMTDAADSPSHLVILTYEDGELVTLYENNVWDYFAGGGLSFVLYQAAGSRTLYALTRNNLQGQYSVWKDILFDETGGQFVAKVLEKTDAYYWAGEEIDYNRYQEIQDEFPDKFSNVVLSNWLVTTDTSVVFRYQTSAMTVAEAEAFLSEIG